MTAKAIFFAAQDRLGHALAHLLGAEGDDRGQGDPVGREIGEHHAGPGPEELLGEDDAVIEVDVLAGAAQLFRKAHAQHAGLGGLHIELVREGRGRVPGVEVRIDLRLDEGPQLLTPCIVLLGQERARRAQPIEIQARFVRRSHQFVLPTCYLRNDTNGVRRAGQWVSRIARDISMRVIPESAQRLSGTHSRKHSRVARP